MDFYHKGYLNNVTVDVENQCSLTRFLDAGMTPTYFSITFDICIYNWY